MSTEEEYTAERLDGKGEVKGCYHQGEDFHGRLWHFIDDIDIKPETLRQTGGKLFDRVEELEELLNKTVLVGANYTCKCELWCNHNQLNVVIGLTESEVTYKYLSTNIHMARNWVKDTTTINHFLAINKLK